MGLFSVGKYDNYSDDYKGPVTITVCTIIALGAGVSYAWSVFSVALQDTYGLSLTEATAPYSISCAVFALCAVIAGFLADRVPPKYVAMFGGLCLGIGVYMCGSANTAEKLIFPVSLAFGPGNAFIGVTCGSTAVKWCSPKRKGLVSGVVISAIALSSLLSSVLAKLFIVTNGVAASFRLLGVLLLFLTVPMSFFIFTPQKDMEITKKHSVIKEIFSSNFIKLWIVYMIGLMAGHTVISQIGNIGLYQIGEINVAGFTAVIAVGNMIGRLSLATLSDKIGCKKTYYLAYCLCALNIGLFFLYKNSSLLYMGSFISGFCYGGLISNSSAALAGLFGKANFALLWGVMQSSAGISGTVGPMLAASAFEHFGDYYIAYFGSCVIIALCITLVRNIYKGK